MQPTSSRTFCGAILLLLFLSLSLFATPTIVNSTVSREHDAVAIRGVLSRRVGERVYFAEAGDVRLTVYDLAAKRWLPDVTFSEPLTAYDVDEDGIYVAFGRRLVRFDTNGGNDHHLTNTPVEIENVDVFGSFLVYGWRDYPRYPLTSIDKNDGSLVDEHSPHYVYFRYGAKNKTLRRLYGIGASTSYHTHQIQLDESGHFSFVRRGAQTAGLLGKLFVAPDDGLVVDDTGKIFHATTLNQAGQLSINSGRATDIAFYDVLPFVLGGNVVTAYARTGEETGRLVLENEPVNIEIYGNAVYLFSSLNSGAAVATVPVSAVTADHPGNHLDATTLDITPTYVAYADDIVYTYAEQYRAIFRYSLVEERYLDPLYVRFAGSRMAYWPAEHAFVSTHNMQEDYWTHGPSTVDLISAETGETTYGIVKVPDGIRGVAAVGDFFLTCRYDDSSSHVTTRADGTDVDVLEPGCAFSQSDWNEATLSLHAANATARLHRVTIGQDGQIEVPLSQNNGAAARPVETNPSGDALVTGSGIIRDGATLSEIGTLPHGVDASAWSDAGLFTLQATGSDTTILQKWRDDYTPANNVTLPGDPIFLAETTYGVVAVTKWQDRLRYSTWSTELDLLSGAIVHQTFLPCAVQNFCQGPWVDNFSDPSSGWPTLQTDAYSGGYYNGTYRLLHETGGFWTAFLRGDVWDDSDLLKVEGRVETGDAVWGVVFGLNDDWSNFRTFEIIPATQQWFLLHFQAETGWGVVDSGTSSYINASGINTIELAKTSTLYPDSIKFRINGHWLFNHAVKAGRVGLTGGAFENNTEIRYDNYVFGDRYCVSTRAPEQSADTISIPWSSAALESLEQ